MVDNEPIAGKIKLSINANDNQKGVFISEKFLDKMMADLEKSEYRILLYIISKPNFTKNEGCEVKLRPTSIILNLSAPGVALGLKGLIDKNFLKKKNDLYYIIDPPESNEDCNNDILEFKLS
jgi:hypothetical protein